MRKNTEPRRELWLQMYSAADGVKKKTTVWLKKKGILSLRKGGKSSYRLDWIAHWKKSLWCLHLEREQRVYAVVKVQHGTWKRWIVQFWSIQTELAAINHLRWNINAKKKISKKVYTEKKTEHTDSFGRQENRCIVWQHANSILDIKLWKHSVIFM